MKNGVQDIFERYCYETTFAGGAKWLVRPSKAVCLQALPFAGQVAQTSLCQMSKVGKIRIDIEKE